MNENFTPIAEVDKYESLILHQKYFSCGNFELYVSNVIPNMRYCYMYEFAGGNVGIVEKTVIEDNRVTYTGRLLKQLLANKVISYTKAFYKKTPEQIVKALVSEFAGQRITVEENKGLGSPVTIQVTGDNLMEFCDSLLETQDLGCEVIYDYINDKIIFRVYQGADNSSFVPMSKNFENITSFKYTHDSSDIRNFAYVAGEVQEGQPRTIVTVDLREDPQDEKLELWVDARDLQSEIQNDDGEIIEIPQEEYEEMLVQRGIKKLQEHKVAEECDIIPAIDLTIGELRYFVDKKSGIESIQRVVELIQAKENNTVRQDAVWGRQKIRRR